MGSNPSDYKGDNNPVQNVSWSDAIYFCNKLSEKYGFTPVYSVDGTTDVSKWGYTPHKSKSIRGIKMQNVSGEDFEKEVLQHESAVLVEFYSDSCIPCKQLSPILGGLEDDYEDKIKIVKIIRQRLKNYTKN